VNISIAVALAGWAACVVFAVVLCAMAHDADALKDELAGLLR
jgi:hypothetical protein